MRDTVVFDADHTDRPSCTRLYLDPEAVLRFAIDDRPHTLTVAGPIESYGVIQLDGTQSPRSSIELRVIDDGSGPPRTLRLMQNSSLLAYGLKAAADGHKNVRLSAAAADRKPARPLVIAADHDVMIDMQDIALVNVALKLQSLDNTGAKASERLNLIGNRFSGSSHLELANCDTPTLRNNVFASAQRINHSAMQLNNCKLAEIHGNRILGNYVTGLMVHTDVDSAFIGNAIQNCATGVHWIGQNAMIRHNTITDCEQRGIILHQSTGSVEHTTVAGSATAFHVTDSQVQFTTCGADDLADDAHAMSAANSTVALINCNLTDDRITLSRNSTVQAMAYLVVQVGGDHPERTQVQVQTAPVSGGVPKNKADLNVRNAPAHLDPEGRTPLPGTMRPLTVRSWKLSKKNNRENAPFYDLIVIAPPEEGQSSPRTLHKQLIEPADDWYRPDPNRGEPTIKVDMK
ncbi:MAG: hypothetical protein CMJ49_07375 [Planctomycetaceae bacterium]|nr:hypothetical protein [Planctomycetaceae bacterium]